MTLYERLMLRVRNKTSIARNQSVDIDKTAKIRDCTILIKGHNNSLKIEANVRLRNTFIEINGNNCSLTIGENSVIGQNCYLSVREEGTSLLISSDCMLSRNVKIMTSDGHNIIKNEQRINHAKSIVIGKHVWLADNATILKGVNIGDHSILGINSTLTKSVEANCIAVGNPAKVVQSDVTWQHELTY